MRNDAELSPEEARRLSQRLMREQASLGLRVAALFMLLLIGLPLLNQFLPQFTSMPVGGFTLSWLILGVIFYPVTWLLSAYFVRESDRIEASHARVDLAGEPMTYGRAEGEHR